MYKFEGIIIPHEPLKGSQSSINMFRMKEICLGEDSTLFTGPDSHRNPQVELQNVGQVCGYYIPPFQRPVVWDKERQASFIESMFLGYDLGRIAYVCDDDSPYDGCVIDGLQRLTAVQEFVLDRVEIFDRYTYETLTVRARTIFDRRFWIPAVRIRDADGEQLRTMYNRMNYGGVAHTEDQRA